MVRQHPLASKFPDRRLGTSWYEWDGDVEKHESRLNERPRLYFSLLFLELFIVTAVLGLDAWFLIHYIFAEWPVAVMIVVFVIGLPLVSWWHAWLFCVLAVVLRSRRLAFPWFSRWLTLQAPFIAWCCRPFGISRDRVASSCIAITNILARLQLRSLSAVRPMVLLPRCLTADTVRAIKSIAAEWDCPVVVVGANRLAREKVREFRPTALVAVACERDLVSGLYDFGHKLPILVLPNERPFGPCLKATLDPERVREALQEIYAKK